MPHTHTLSAVSSKSPFARYGAVRATQGIAQVVLNVGFNRPRRPARALMLTKRPPPLAALSVGRRLRPRDALMPARPRAPPPRLDPEPDPSRVHVGRRHDPQAVRQRGVPLRRFQARFVRAHVNVCACSTASVHGCLSQLLLRPTRVPCGPKRFWWGTGAYPLHAGDLVRSFRAVNRLQDRTLQTVLTRGLPSHSRVEVRR